MDGWMDELMDGWMNGWMDGWMVWTGSTFACLPIPQHLHDYPCTNHLHASFQYTIVTYEKKNECKLINIINGNCFTGNFPAQQQNNNNNNNFLIKGLPTNGLDQKK